MDGTALIFADVVSLRPASPKIVSPVHFHPQAELVWFRKVHGTVSLEGTNLPLRDGVAVLLPSMQVHAFETEAGARDWVLLQFEPVLIEAMAQQLPGVVLDRPMILRPSPEDAARIDYLCNWLARIVTTSERALEAQQVMQLILVILSATPAESTVTFDPPKPLSQPLQDVLRRVHADPRSAPSLSAAARAARVSDSYFSRLFKARVGMGFASYVQQHRLNTAARLLVTGSKPVSQIAYMVGFSSVAHFSTAFSDRFGLSPRSFRKRALGGTGRQQETKSY